GIEFVNLPSLSIQGFATLLTSKGDGTLLINIGNGIGSLVEPPEVYCGNGTASDPHRYTVTIVTEPASYTLSSRLTITGQVKVTDLQGIGMTALLNQLGVVAGQGGK